MVEELFVFVNAGDSEVRRAFFAVSEEVEKGNPLGWVRETEVNDVDHLLAFHGFHDGLVGDHVRETEERAEVEKVAAGGEGLGGSRRRRVEDDVEATPGAEDSESEGMGEAGRYALHGVARWGGEHGDVLETLVSLVKGVGRDLLGASE